VNHASCSKLQRLCRQRLVPPSTVRYPTSASHPSNIPRSLCTKLLRREKAWIDGVTCASVAAKSLICLPWTGSSLTTYRHRQATGGSALTRSIRCRPKWPTGEQGTLPIPQVLLVDQALRPDPSAIARPIRQMTLLIPACLGRYFVFLLVLFGDEPLVPTVGTSPVDRPLKRPGLLPT
jgi:hypothetical protein